MSAVISDCTKFHYYCRILTGVQTNEANVEIETKPLTVKIEIIKVFNII